MHPIRILCAMALGLSPLAAMAHHSGGHSRQVTATVYDSWYSGRTTACGNTYQHWGISAAHPWLPCGSRVKVSHKGRSLIVPIRDTCDCNSIDLSAGAAHRLGVPLDGIARVRITEL